jgi:hypothetical protein
MKRSVIMCIVAILSCLSLVEGHDGRDWERDRDRDWLIEKDGEYMHHPREVMIKESKFTFAKLFDIDSSHGHLGNVVKSRYTLRTHYDYYGTKGDSDLIAKGYLRFFSWGKVFTWASVLDIYSAADRYLGRIDGCLMTLSPSKFNFYDADGNRIGTAYMDANKLGFTVICAKDDRTIAKYTRMCVPGETDYWYLNIYEDDVPPSMLVIFFDFYFYNQVYFNYDN